MRVYTGEYAQVYAGAVCRGVHGTEDTGNLNVQAYWPVQKVLQDFPSKASVENWCVRRVWRRPGPSGAALGPRRFGALFPKAGKLIGRTTVALSNDLGLAAVAGSWGGAALKLAVS
jgi:hypothetical protein